MENKKITKAWPALKGSLIEVWQTENLGYLVKTYIAFTAIISVLFGVLAIIQFMFGMVSGLMHREAGAQTLDSTMVETTMMVEDTSPASLDEMMMEEDTSPSMMMTDDTSPAMMLNDEEVDFSSMTDEELQAEIEKMMQEYEATGTAPFAPEDIFPFLGLGIAIILLVLVGASFIASYASVLFLGAVINIREKNIPLIRDAVKKALKKVLPMLGLGAILFLTIGLGVVLFIVPGIILGVMFVFAPIILLKEDVGVFEALSRSANLTKGYKWQLFVRKLGLMFIGVLLMAGTSIFGYMLMPVLSPLIAGAYNLVLYGYYKELKEIKAGGASVMGSEAKGSETVENDSETSAENA